MCSPAQIDIEGAEFSSGGFSDWISTGALNNVNQIALELHVRQSDFVPLVELLQQLYRLGFRLISQARLYYILGRSSLVSSHDDLSLWLVFFSGE